MIFRGRTGAGLFLTAALLVAPGAGRADEVADAVAEARARLDRGDVDGCLASLRAVRRAHPRDLRPAPLLAWVLFSKKDRLSEAADLLEEVLRAGPGAEGRGDVDYAAGLLHSVGRRALDRGQPELALRCARVLTAVRPGEKAYRYALALALYRLGERDAVERTCRGLILDFPSFDAAYYLLARVQVDGERYEEARKTYLRLIQERPGEAEPRMMLGSLLLWQMRDYRGARSAYRQALEAAGRDAALRGRIRKELERLDEMREQAERARVRYRRLGWILVVILAVYGTGFVLVLRGTRGGPPGES